MRYGVYVPSYGRYGDPHLLRDLAVATENAGWDGFFMYDVITWDDYESPVADPWVTLAAAATATSRIHLGPMAVPLPRRRPWKLALEARTLQELSRGRLILGVSAGVGWDYLRFGESAGGRERGERLDEGVVLLKEFLTGKPVRHDGKYYQANDVQLSAAEVPVWTTGFWPRTVPFRGATGADGIFPQVRDPNQDFRLPSVQEVREIRAEFGAGDLALWSPLTEPSAELAGDYADAGATWWFSNGADVTPEDLYERIAAGPPR